MNGIAIKKVLLFSERGFVRSPREKRRKNTPVTARWQFMITDLLAQRYLDPPWEITYFQAPERSPPAVIMPRNDRASPVYLTL